MQILLKATKNPTKGRRRTRKIEAKPDENELQVETTKSWQNGHKKGNAGEDGEKIVVQHHMAWPGRIAAG